MKKSRIDWKWNPTLREIMDEFFYNYPQYKRTPANKKFAKEWNSYLEWLRQCGTISPEYLKQISL